MAEVERIAYARPLRRLLRSHETIRARSRGAIRDALEGVNPAAQRAAYFSSRRFDRCTRGRLRKSRRIQQRSTGDERRCANELAPAELRASTQSRTSFLHAITPADLFEP